MIDYCLEVTEFESRQKKKNSSVPKHPHLFWVTNSLLFQEYWAISSGVQWTRRKIYYSPPPSFEVKN
jgi:hypothetical protein